MDYGRESGFSSGNVVQILTGPQSNGVAEDWGSGSIDQAIWATEDEYGAWNREPSVDNSSNSNYDGRQSQTRSGSEPPNKKSRNSQSGDNRAKAIGKMFFKTKLCCKFRAGTCPYVTNCNFAHSIEELRRPPPNWQEIVAAHEEERGVSSEPREEFQIPSIGSSGFSAETQRSYKGRHCKKFYTEEGCPYGDSCSFLHDEHSKARESVAISLGPGSGGNYGGNASGSTIKPSNWKTRICNKWELTGYCPFGNKCHFAHGAQGISLHLLTVESLSWCNQRISTMTGDRSPNPTGGLILSNTDSIRSFLASASDDLRLPQDLRQTASNLSAQPSVPYKPLRSIWFATEPSSARPDLLCLLSGSNFVLNSPKPREKSEELKVRLRKLEELAERKAYAELVKDITPKKGTDEPFSSYKDQLGFGLHVVLIMFTGFLVGYAGFRALFSNNPVMNAAGGILGLVCGMLVETLLFIIRTSSLDHRSSSSTSKLKKNQ